jgi:hypothetical protein
MFSWSWLGRTDSSSTRSANRKAASGSRSLPPAAFARYPFADWPRLRDRSEICSSTDGIADASHTSPVALSTTMGPAPTTALWIRALFSRNSFESQPKIQTRPSSKVDRIASSRPNRGVMVSCRYRPAAAFASTSAMCPIGEVTDRSFIPMKK